MTHDEMLPILQSWQDTIKTAEADIAPCWSRRLRCGWAEAFKEIADDIRNI